MSEQSGRRYSDREVQLILKTATDLQRRSVDNTTEPPGMSLAELEHAATEAGIDPALVRHAAAQLDTPSALRVPKRFVGAPTELLVERVVDVHVEPEFFDRFLEVVRATTHEVGEANTIGREFGWKGRLHDARTDVSVSAGETRTTVRVRVVLDEGAVADIILKGTLFGLGGMIGTAILSPLVGLLSPAVGLGMVGLGYAWARRGVSRTRANYRRAAKDLVDVLAARAADLGGPRKLSSS